MIWCPVPTIYNNCMYNMPLYTCVIQAISLAVYYICLPGTTHLATLAKQILAVWSYYSLYESISH